MGLRAEFLGLLSGYQDRQLSGCMYDILLLIFLQGVHLGGHFLPKSGHFDLKLATNENAF